MSPASSTWHLCWQAAVGRNLLGHASLPWRLRERLLDAHDKPGRVLIGYLLVPTEIHALSALSIDESPGAVARAVGNVVSRWVRAVEPVRSPVLAGPYRAMQIGSDDALRAEVRMLAWRPVSLGLCRAPAHYPHGALRTVLGLTPAHGFDARPQLGLFHGTVPGARAALRAWVAKRPSPREARSWELTRGLALATGAIGPSLPAPGDVRSAAAAVLMAAAGSVGLQGALGLLEAWVLARLGLPCAADLQGSSDPTGTHARARALVACLAVEHRVCSAAAVARHYGRAKSTLSEQMALCRARPSDRQTLRTAADRIAEEAVALALRRAQPLILPPPA